MEIKERKAMVSKHVKRQKQSGLLSAQLSSYRVLSGQLSPLILFFGYLLIVSLSLYLPGLTWSLILFGAYGLVVLFAMQLLPELFLLRRAEQWSVLGVIVGVNVFAWITPANAAIFDTAEQYTIQIFGPYVDPAMITLIFGFLRISSFLVGAAFVMLALEKARHGENWQPFAWNAFAVLMVVVLVEGMSALFLSTTTAAG